nr:MAG TPA_asm: hypothetical protein [Caudoviricetes sp.]
MLSSIRGRRWLSSRRGKWQNANGAELKLFGSALGKGN